MREERERKGRGKREKMENWHIGERGGNEKKNFVTFSLFTSLSCPKLPVYSLTLRQNTRGESDRKNTT